MRYWIALEGPRWYISKLERNGWEINRVIEATDQEHAEWLFAQSHNKDYAVSEAVKNAKKSKSEKTNLKNLAPLILWIFQATKV